MTRFAGILKAAVFFMLIFCSAVFAVTEAEAQKIAAAMPKEGAVSPKEQRKILVFSLCNGFKHGSIPYWKKALEIMGEKAGAFSVEFSEDMAAFSADNLRRFDAVCLNNTTKLTFTEVQKEAFLSYIKGGGGLIGIHAATDNFYDWPEAAQIIGGRFSGHPWQAEGTWAIKIDLPDHPLTKMFGGKGFKVSDEIYRTAAPFYGRDKQLVLMSLDMSDEATKNAKGVTPEDMDTGISWIKQYGKGRVFYCSLGHNPHIVQDKAILEHFLAGIQFALGDLDIPTTPAAAAGLTGREKERLGRMISAASKYDWKDSRLALTELEEFVLGCYGDKAKISEIEKSLLAALESRGTAPAAKDFICRQLSVYGTQAGADTLAKLLKQAETADMARYALERIPGKKIDDVLLDATDKADDKTKIGIISTLGKRGVLSAVSRLSAYPQDKNETVAAAALSAIGGVGGKEAAEALSACEGKVSPALQRRFLESWLVCAGKLRKDNKPDAIAIYQRLYTQENPSLIRAAALRGLFACGQAEPRELILKGLADKERQVRTAATGLIKELSGADISAVISGLPELSGAEQVQVLGALEAGDAAAAGYAIKALGSGDSAVRFSAIKALGAIGGVSAIEPLLQAAAEGDKNQKEAARRSLSAMGGAEADKAIIEMIKAPQGQSEKVYTELIYALGQRNIAALPLLAEVIKTANGQVKQQAIQSLQEIAVPSDMAVIAELLSQRPEPAVQSAVISVALKQPQRKGRAKVLNEYLKDISDASVVKAFLSVLGRIGDPDSIEALKRWSASKDAELSEAAFRAMCDWPGDEMIEDMLSYAQSKELAKSVLAIRSGVRMTGESENKSCPEKAELLGKFLTLALRIDEKKLVLGALGSCICAESILSAAQCLDQNNLTLEAQIAIISVLEKRNGPVIGREKEIILKIIEKPANETIAKKAAEIKKRMK